MIEQHVASGFERDWAVFHTASPRPGVTRFDRLGE
jgi:hypothetical protein